MSKIFYLSTIKQNNFIMELSVEIKRAEARGAHKVSTLGMAVVPMDLATIRKGDIITIPADWKNNILSAPIRGSFREEPVTDANGIEIGKKKVQQEAVYVYLTVERGGSKTNVQFYPSFFTKRRRIAGTENDFKNASGDVVNFVQEYATMDEAFDALVNKPFVVEDLEPFKTYRFGSDTETRNDWVPKFSFKQTA